MYKNLKRKIMFCLDKVILGFIPRIQLKHHTLSRHYRACPDNLDPRVEPEDDRNKGLNTGIFDHTLNVILGFIPRIHAKHHDLCRHYRVCPDNLDPRVEPEDDNRKRMFVTPEDDNLVAQCGRSMIEMLGVLAIVGVLSVGGIQGYSKAMEKIKVNKTLSEYNTLMFGFFQHIDDIRKIPENDASPYAFYDLLVALDIIPISWKGYSKFVTDDLGNTIRFYPNSIEVMFNYGNVGGNNRISFCRALYDLLAKSYQNELNHVYIWKGGKTTDIVYYGNRYCGENVSCIRNMTLNDINKQCQICDKIDKRTCSLVLHF